MKPVDDFNPPDPCGDERCRDYFMEFIYCFVIPAGVVFLVTFFILISCLCSCCKKKKPLLEEHEMECYNTIRRASQSLRDLSNKRDTLLEPRSGSMSLPRNGAGQRSRRTCHSAPNTLQRERRRHHGEGPPPAYQELPVYTSRSVSRERHPLDACEGYDYPPSSYQDPRASDCSSFRSGTGGTSQNRYSMT